MGRRGAEDVLIFLRSLQLLFVLSSNVVIFWKLV